MYLKCEYFPTSDSPWMFYINDFILRDERRKVWFDKLVTRNRKNKDNAKKVKDIYYHSIEFQNNIINPRTRTLVLLTKIFSENMRYIIPYGN